MSRPIWKGQISFGLVNVPVTLYSAEQRADLHFNLIDSRNAARIRYERVNEETGEEVPWDKIVKGYEFDGGSYVLFSDKELEQASVEMTKVIEIEQFVDADEIDAIYFDKPYYLVPGKGGEKGYVLLREAMAESGKVGIARVVIRTRQYIAALVPEKSALVLSLLRYHQEIRPLKDFDIPSGTPAAHNIRPKELELAGQLIEGMSGDWKPEEFEDEYRGALMKLIDKKIKSGQTKEIAEPEDEEQPLEPRTINFMDVLVKSVERTGGGVRMAKSERTRRRTGSSAPAVSSVARKTKSKRAKSARSRAAKRKKAS
jgi:DNA end-binding protein Ku